MAVMMTLELAGATTAQYDRMKELLATEDADDVSAGLVARACGVTDDGIVLVEVWDSEEILDEFVHGKLAPALAEAGMSFAVPRASPVHDLVFGRGEDPKTLVLLETPGMTAKAYDGIVAKMASHAESGSTHPAVLHIAALEADGFRNVDVWGSEDEFRAFAATELLPAVADPRHFVLRIWPLHDFVAARPRANV